MRRFTVLKQGKDVFMETAIIYNLEALLHPMSSDTDHELYHLYVDVPQSLATSTRHNKRNERYVHWRRDSSSTQRRNAGLKAPGSYILITGTGAATQKLTTHVVPSAQYAHSMCLQRMRL